MDVDHPSPYDAVVAGREINAHKKAIDMDQTRNRWICTVGKAIVLALVLAASEYAHAVGLPDLSRKGDRVLVCAHRANHGDAPENSLSAIKACIAGGVDIIEIDVRKTKDGILVLMHDETVDRTTNGSGAIKDLTWAEVSKLRLYKAAGRNKILTNEQVPSLQQALRLSKGNIYINLDLKNGVRIVEDCANVIAETQTEHIIMYRCSGLNYLKYISENFPEMHLSPHFDAQRNTMNWPGTGTGLQFLTPYLEAIEVWGLDLKDPDHPVLSTENANELKRLGVHVWSWTMWGKYSDREALKEPAAVWGKLIDRGISVIMTDEPEALITYLKATNRRGPAEAKPAIEVTPFGQMPDGREVRLYQLHNPSGMSASIMTYGAIVVSIKTPDRDGRLHDIVLGYDDLDSYLEKGNYFGAVIGRYANRIGTGTFSLDGVTYTLATNNGENHLHGGDKGFDKVLWHDTPVRRSDCVGVKLTYLSKDEEEGYPGNLSVSVTYLLTDKNELRIEYEATTDKPTPVNLTHHGYFNLTGGRTNILSHRLMVNAGRYTPVRDGMLPTGQVTPVTGTPMDFLTPTEIGARIEEDHEQLRLGNGYDHNYVLNRGDKSLTLAARVYEPTTGRVMEVRTREPGIQFYSGNWLNGARPGKGGTAYKRHWGLCLETQHFPDSPNQPDFPSTILRPGETYRTTTVYWFSTT